MNQLDETGIVGSDDDCLIYQPGQRSPTLPQKCDTGNSPLPRRAGSGDQVRALAAGAVQDQEVARAADSLYLAGKNLVEPQIVACRGKDGGVGRQGDGRQGSASFDVAHHVFRREVLRIGSAAAVATE